MKKKAKLVTGLAIFALCGSAFAECTFRLHVYGSTPTYKLINQGIGPKITEEFCRRYNKTHEIVIIADEYQSPQRTLVNVSVALRKRGSSDLPSRRHSTYQFQDGNFVVGKMHELAASAALDTVMDVMSDLDSYVN